MASNITDSLESKLLKSATTYQQYYYEIVSDYNRYELDQLDYLKDFIGYALFGPPNVAEGFYSKDDNVRNIVEENRYDEDGGGHYVYSKKQGDVINSIFDKVIEYSNGKESGEGILCGLIYNVVYNRENALKGKQKKLDEAKNGKVCRVKGEKKSLLDTGTTKDAEESSEDRTHVFPIPIFKVKAALSSKEKKKSISNAKDVQTENKIYYIDTEGRIYDGFQDYLKTNTLRQCTMVLPKDGRYQMDREHFRNENRSLTNADDVITTVWVEVHESPDNDVTAKVLNGADIANTVVTVASMGVAVAACITPIGAGVALAGTVGAGVSGLWSIGRSAQQLADRGVHGESINVTDKNALGAWIGIAGGAMGFAASGSAAFLSRAVRTGTSVGRTATLAHDAILIGNLITNGFGLGYKGYDIIATYRENGEISPREVFFLTAHLFFFCNSVVNIRFAQNIIETSQGQLLKDYEASLRSNRHRKEFQRMARNTRAAGKSVVSSNEEIIRSINKISNKDEFFQSMVRNRKAFSSSGAKASFADGQVSVNSAMIIDPIEFAKLPKDVRIETVRNVSSVQPNETAGTATTIRMNETSYKNFTANNKQILKDFCLKHAEAMIQTAPPMIADFSNVLDELATVQNSAMIFIKLLDIAYKILQAIPRDEVKTLGDVTASIVQFLWNYVKSCLRRLSPGSMIDDPSARIVIDNITQKLVICVEEKIDMWAAAFKEWLRENLTQSLNGCFLNDPATEVKQ